MRLLEESRKRKKPEGRTGDFWLELFVGDWGDLGGGGWRGDRRQLADAAFGGGVQT